MAIEAPTKIGIISDTLLLMGLKPASSLTEDRYGVTVLAGLFEVIYENELQSNRWRFACAKGALSQLVAAPLNQWQYAYQLPAEMLLPLHIYPSQPYEIYADTIYSNASAVELDYVFKPNIDALPAYFAVLLTYALARDSVKAITESDSAVEVMEAKYSMQRNRALFADAQGRPATPIVHAPFTQGVGRARTW